MNNCQLVQPNFGQIQEATGQPLLTAKVKVEPVGFSPQPNALKYIYVPPELRLYYESK